LAKAARDKAMQDSIASANEKIKQLETSRAAREKATRDSIAYVEQN